MMMLQSNKKNTQVVAPSDLPQDLEGVSKEMAKDPFFIELFQKNFELEQSNSIVGVESALSLTIKEYKKLKGIK